MSETKQKNYINGVWIYERTFDNGGSVLNLNIIKDDFIKNVQKLTPNEKGYVRLVISKKREIKNDTDSTHSIYENDFNPGGKKNVAAESKATRTPSPTDTDDSSDSVI